METIKSTLSRKLIQKNLLELRPNINKLFNSISYI